MTDQAARDLINVLKAIERGHRDLVAQLRRLTVRPGVVVVSVPDGDIPPEGLEQLQASTERGSGEKIRDL